MGARFEDLDSMAIVHIEKEEGIEEKKKKGMRIIKRENHSVIRFFDGLSI